MLGFEAISQSNGWSMAGVGASIVLTGLLVLSLIISQLHRAITLFDFLLEKRQERRKKMSFIVEEVSVQTSVHNPTDPVLAEQDIKPLCDELGSTFTLSALYILAQQRHVPHAHLSIRTLREAGKILLVEEDTFSYAD